MARRRSRSSATGRYSERARSGGTHGRRQQSSIIPLVQHKLTLIRDKNISTKSFRELLKEIGMLLCYEVTRDLPLTRVEIETPLARMMSPRIAGKKLVFAPILRAGVTFAEGMLDLVPAARIAHIGLYREPEILRRGRIFLQGAVRPSRAACHRRRAGDRHRQYRLRRHRAAQGKRRQRYPLRVPARGTRGAGEIARVSSRRAASGRRPSTRASTNRDLLFPASATPATGPMARNKLLDRG